MSGTILGTLSPVPGVDNVKISSGQGGFTTVQAGATGNKLYWLASASMGGAAGYQFLGGTETTWGFIEMPTQTNPIFAFRKYWRFATQPTGLTAIDRFYPSTAHATANSLSCYLDATRKLQLVEAGVTATPIGTGSVALPAATDLCTLGLIKGATGDAEAGKVILRHYLRGSTDLILEQTATMAAPLTINSWRPGIGNANTALGTLNLNDMTAWGNGDWLDRADYVSATFDPPLDPGAKRIYTTNQKVIVRTGYTGTKSYRLLRAGSQWAASQSSNSFTVPIGSVIDETTIQAVVESAT